MQPTQHDAVSLADALQAVENRLIARHAHRLHSRGGYPAEMWPHVTRMHQARVPATEIARELHQLPGLRTRTYQALYRAITRHIERLRAPHA